jgi:hypothetical protein
MDGLLAGIELCRLRAQPKHCTIQVGARWACILPFFAEPQRVFYAMGGIPGVTTADIRQVRKVTLAGSRLVGYTGIRKPVFSPVAGG